MRNLCGMGEVGQVFSCLLLLSSCFSEFLSYSATELKLSCSPNLSSGPSGYARQIRAELQTHGWHFARANITYANWLHKLHDELFLYNCYIFLTQSLTFITTLNQLQGIWRALKSRKFLNISKAASGWLRGATWPASLSVTCLSILTDFT